MTQEDTLFANDDLAALSKAAGDVCFVLGFASIAASIAVWAKAKQGDAAHGERFGIFVGLWAPTFFILSDRLTRKRP